MVCDAGDARRRKSPTSNTKFWVASGATPLLATIVIR
jgi:hypothetical protein